MKNYRYSDDLDDDVDDRADIDCKECEISTINSQSKMTTVMYVFDGSSLPNVLILSYNVLTHCVAD